MIDTDTEALWRQQREYILTKKNTGKLNLEEEDGQWFLFFGDTMVHNQPVEVKIKNTTKGRTVTLKFKDMVCVPDPMIKPIKGPVINITE